MSDYTIDFGFEGRGVSFEEARVALLFAGNTLLKDLETAVGPTALADASRYIELFEMQVGVSPMDIGVYTEIIGGEDPSASAIIRSKAASAAGKTAIRVAGSRRIAEDGGREPLVARWGKIGRSEADEASLFHGRQTVLVGIRAATFDAFKAMGGNIAVVTPKAFLGNKEALTDIIDKIKTPVHLSIDLDVLAPGVVQLARSVEPGGFSWYNLMDALEILFNGPGVSSVDITGTETISPRSPAACLGAQLIINIAGLIRARESS
jgi:hypothetical protein